MVNLKTAGSTLGKFPNIGLSVIGSLSGGKSKTSAGSGTAAAPAKKPDYKGIFRDLSQEMYESVYRPGELVYEPKDSAVLSGEIAGWLRPVYDRMIAARREDTARYGAELDADAYARGMGSSTYVSDVKSRQQREEAADISLMETDYGATLAKNLSEALNAQNELKLSVEMFNAERSDSAYDQAYRAAEFLLPYIAG